jgi:hypothetical protein
LACGCAAGDPSRMKKYSKSRSRIAKKASISAIHAKKTAGLDRVRELLRTLPPEVSAKLDQKELNTGVAVMTKNKMPDNKAVIQSPSEGMYSWNGSNAMTGPEIIEKIMALANG